MDTSTLADCGLELLRSKERDAVLADAELQAALHLNGELSRTLERERAAHGRELRERDVRLNEELSQRELDILRRQEDIVRLRAGIATRDAEIFSRDAELAAARQLSLRVEESVTWQTFQRMRSRLYGAIGERSLLARALGLSLRLAGKALIKRPRPTSSPPELEDDQDPSSAAEDTDIETISLPEY